MSDVDHCGHRIAPVVVAQNVCWMTSSEKMLVSLNIWNFATVIGRFKISTIGFSWEHNVTFGHFDVPIFFV